MLEGEWSTHLTVGDQMARLLSSSHIVGTSWFATPKITRIPGGLVNQQASISVGLNGNLVHGTD